MSIKQQLEKEIRDAIAFLRTNNNTIPSDTIQLMLHASLEKVNKSVVPNEQVTLTVSDIKNKITQLEIREYFKYPRTLSPDEINEILDELGYIDIEIQRDWNGCDLDWSMIDDLTLNNMRFHIFGSVISGNFMIQRIS